MSIFESLPSILPLMIPIVAIVGAFAYAIANSQHKAEVAIAMGPDDKLKRLTEENLALNRQILARLDSIEQRLVGVEKLLKEVPQ